MRKPSPRADLELELELDLELEVGSYIVYSDASCGTLLNVQS